MHRLKAVLVAVIFLVFGTYRIAHRWWVVSHWQEVPASYDRVWVEETRTGAGSNYAVNVLYSYVINGETHQSQTFDLEDRGPIHGDPSTSEAIAAELRARAAPTCWVDPGDPSRAVLDLSHDYEFDVVILVIGLVAAAVACGGNILAVLFRLGRRGKSPASSTPVEEWWRSWFPVGCAWLVMGAAVIGLTVHELIQKRAVWAWAEVPSVIEDSRLTFSSHEWKASILYSYVWEGQTHRTNQVSFDTFSGSVTKAENRIAAYPVGSTTVCYVNPARPTEAVLIRADQPPWGMTTASILLLALAGGSVIKARREWIAIKQARLAAESPACEENEEADETDDANRPPVLIPLRPPPTRRELVETQLARGLEVSTLLRRRFLQMLPWCFVSSLLVAWLARDVLREWSLGVWATISQWIALAALGLTCALPFLAALMVRRWWENRRLRALLRVLGQRA